ncbi:MAG: hypothetical protein CM1200mP3_06670 [Chloroflexota bacterium]|nr:MAG: hypothetical protein CM1200mP3_06670 [Chloroflexota bacterium]
MDNWFVFRKYYFDLSHDISKRNGWVVNVMNIKIVASLVSLVAIAL